MVSVYQRKLISCIRHAMVMCHWSSCPFSGLEDRRHRGKSMEHTWMKGVTRKLREQKVKKTFLSEEEKHKIGYKNTDAEESHKALVAYSFCPTPGNIFILLSIAQSCGSALNSLLGALSIWLCSSAGGQAGTKVGATALQDFGNSTGRWGGGNGSFASKSWSRLLSHEG